VRHVGLRSAPGRPVAPWAGHRGRPNVYHSNGCSSTVGCVAGELIPVTDERGLTEWVHRPPLACPNGHPFRPGDITTYRETGWDAGVPERCRRSGRASGRGTRCSSAGCASPRRWRRRVPTRRSGPAGQPTTAARALRTRAGGGVASHRRALAGPHLGLLDITSRSCPPRQASCGGTSRAPTADGGAFSMMRGANATSIRSCR
jgi:hypothetical protein